MVKFYLHKVLLALRKGPFDFVSTSYVANLELGCKEKLGKGRGNSKLPSQTTWGGSTLYLGCGRQRELFPQPSVQLASGTGCIQCAPNNSRCQGGRDHNCSALQAWASGLYTVPVKPTRPTRFLKQKKQQEVKLTMTPRLSLG